MLRPIAAIALVAALPACAAPRRAIPMEQAVLAQRPFAFGALEANPGRATVVELKRVGPREDASTFLHLDAEGRLSAEVLEAGRRAPRAATLADLEEAASLLSGREVRAWVAARMDAARLERALAGEVEARREAASGLIGDLAEAFRDERAAVELREGDARRRNTFFLGILGWQRGAFSGYSWSFPLHIERYDRSEDVREVAVLPLLSGARFERDGAEVLVAPLFGYFASVESPVDRVRGAVLLGVGRTVRESIEGRSTTTLVVPLLGIGWDEDVAPGRAPERSLRLFWLLKI